MAKYIIEIPDDRIGDFVGNTHLLMPYTMAGHKGHHDTGLEMTPYTEPDEDEIRQKVEQEVWEFARKIVNMGYEEFSKCFDVSDDYWEVNIMDVMTYSEAKARYDDWEHNKERPELAQGQEWITTGGLKCVLIAAGGADIWILNEFGSIGVVEDKCLMRFTGRVFTNIIDMLKAMTGE